MGAFRSNTGCLLRSVATRYRPWGRSLSWRHTQLGNNSLLLWNLYIDEHAPTGVGVNARDEHLAQLEAVLLLTQQPIASRKLAELAGLADGTKARTLVRALNRMYDVQGCAFRAEEVAGGFQLMSRTKFAPWLRRLHAGGTEIRLSGPAMETLAVVAYRQPILRAEIEAIRGVQSGEVLRQLIERDLVRIVGRSQELGRPLLYGTSKRFLQIFGLKHIEELPRPEFLQIPQTAITGQDANQGGSSEDISKQPNYSTEAKEETNVKTLTTIKAHPREFTQQSAAFLTPPDCRGLSSLNSPRAQDKDVDEDDKEDDEDEDFDDLDEDEDDEEDEDLNDEDEDIDDEPWEEVEDDDESEADEDEEDEDWDDEDWEDEDEDWDEDEDEEDDEEDEVK